MAFQTNNSGTFDSGIMMQQQQLLPYSPFGSSIASSGSQVPRQQNSFPCTVHRMLSEAEAGAFSNVACWMPHGRSFKILDRKRFVKEILPR